MSEIWIMKQLPLLVSFLIVLLRALLITLLIFFAFFMIHKIYNKSKEIINKQCAKKEAKK